MRNAIEQTEWMASAGDTADFGRNLAEDPDVGWSEPQDPYERALQALRDVRHMLPAGGIAIVDAALNAASAGWEDSDGVAESLLSFLEGRGDQEAPLFTEIPVFVGEQSAAEKHGDQDQASVLN
jgi:hypothetical protein